MASKKTFINPLTRSSETDLNLSSPTPVVEPVQIEGAGNPGRAKRTKRKEEIFEETHQRFTAWVDRGLKKQFDDLAAKKEMSKSALLNEAITVLLHKEERKPYTRGHAK